MSLLHTVSEDTHSDVGNLNPDTSRRRRTEPPAPPTSNSAHTGGSLTRVTANFTPRAMAALERISEKTGDSRTDVLNMAVMAYDTVLDLIAAGDGRTLRLQMPDGEIQVLHFIG